MKFTFIVKIALLAISIAMVGSPISNVNGATATEQDSLCSPGIARVISSSGDEIYPVADNYFRHKAYGAAARAYYQTFLCLGTPLGRGYVGALDDGQTLAFRAALRLGVDGKFDLAAPLLDALKSELPFVEAGYMAGIYHWANGDKRKAVSDWIATANGPYIPLSDSPSGEARDASRRMITWAQSQGIPH